MSNSIQKQTRDKTEGAWISLKQAALLRTLLIVAGVILGVLLLGSWASAAAGSLLLLLVASVLALALNPLVMWLEVHRVPRSLSAVVVVLLVMGFIGGGVILIAPLLYVQGTRFVVGIPNMLGRLNESLPWLMQFPGVADLVSGKSSFSALLGSSSNALMFGVSNAATGLIGVIASLFLLLTMIIFLLVNPQPVVRGLLSAIPSSMRSTFERLLSRLGRQLSLWLVAALTISVLLGVLVTVGLALVGFQDALLFGAIYAVCNLVPVIGPLVGMLPAMLFAAANGQWTALLWAMIIPVLLQQLDGYFFSPFIFRRTTQLQPLSIIISVSVFSSLMGFIGTFLAVPMVIIVKAIYEEIYLPNIDNALVSEQDIAAVLDVSLEPVPLEPVILEPTQ